MRMIYTRDEYFDVYWYGMTKEEWERSGRRWVSDFIEFRLHHDLYRRGAKLLTINERT
jgi:hypothetical protein